MTPERRAKFIQVLVALVLISSLLAMDLLRLHLRSELVVRLVAYGNALFGCYLLYSAIVPPRESPEDETGSADADRGE